MIARRRLHTQRLIGPKFQTPIDAVSFLTAVQAQDTLYSLWALGMRVAGATEAAVEQAIADRLRGIVPVLVSAEGLLR